jgi:hypothetical protein
MIVNNASKVIIDDSRVMLQIVAPLTGDSLGVIYDHSMLIGQDPDLTCEQNTWLEGSHTVQQYSA